MRNLHENWLAAAILSFLVCIQNTQANVGPASTGGQIIGEPIGLIDVDNTREKLHLDLRPLAQKGLARVEATYFLRNKGQTKTLELLFASGAPELTTFKVWMDETPIQTHQPGKIQLPTAWQPPPSTPGLSGGQSLVFGGQKTHPIAFQVTIPPGDHTLKVTFSADATINRLGEPTLYHQFVYILAPAKAWASFGSLELQIELPSGWRVASDPNIPREGDTLRAVFDQLPGDAISLTLQAAESPVYWLVLYASQVLLILAFAFGAWFCFQSGWTKPGKLNSESIQVESLPNPFPLARVCGRSIGWAVTLLGSGYWAILGPEAFLPNGQVSHYGYGQAFALVGITLLGIGLLPLGFLVAFVGRGLARFSRRSGNG